MLVECYADKTLVNALGIPETHRQGVGNVINKLKDSQSSEALVDEDPGCTRPTYLAQLKVIAEEHQIKVLYDEKLKNYVIVLCPRLEQWVLQAALQSGVQVTDYGLSDNPDQLHSELLRSETKREFLKQFITDIKDKSPMLKTLEQLLKRPPANPIP